MLVANWGYGFAQLSAPPHDAGKTPAQEMRAGMFTGKKNSAESNIRGTDATSETFSESFEGETFPPDGWALINNGGPKTWERVALSGHTSSYVARIAYEATTHDDWLITPALQPLAGSSTLAFWSKNESVDTYFEKLNVMLSTTGSNKEDFTVTLASDIIPPTAFTQYSYDLSAYIGQVVYVAVQATSQNMNMLYLDDFSGPAFYTAAGEGTFNGFVYDQTTNAAIAGATVNFTGTENYSVLTGANGAYSTAANIGVYSITASASGYTSQMLENINLSNNATVSNNFNLTEAPEGVAVVTATEIDDNSVRIKWSDEIPSELVKITQNPGAPVSAYWQFNVHGFGVVYNLADYPDAVINSMNFHHTSFGVFGAWDYFIHVYNWSDTTLIETFGPYTTKGNDTWEMGIDLGNISSGGVEKVAIILQPQGHLQSNAYPCLSTDKQSNAQGSITGMWDKPYTYSTSIWGNFLMEMYIYTANGKLEAAPRLADVGEIDSRAVESYDVWREKVGQPETLVKIGTTTAQEELVDNAWGTLSMGAYRWAVTANYATGEVSEPVFSNTLVKYSCEDFDGPVVVEAEVVNGSNIKVNWSNTANPEMVELTQNPGIADNGDYQMFNFVYGVAYDISAYSDATLNNMNFHHKAWGTFGNWEYKIHIYNWDNRSLIQSFGPLTTTGNDKWENVPLQDVNLNGASKVGIFMEPMGYQPQDAYPNLGADNAEDPQGSLWGPISQINSLIPPNMGNWVMNAWINTSYGAVKATPVTSEPGQTHIADFHSKETKNNRPIATTGSIASAVKQTANRVTRDAVVGANVYRNGVLIAEALTGDSYLDTAVEPGDYTYCVTYVYQSGGESCPDVNCAEVSLTVDVKSNDLSQIKVYPNPTNSTVNIDLTPNVSQVAIYNYLGQVILENTITDQTTLQIDVRNYESGAYLVKFITSEGQSITKKVVVTK